MQVVTDKPYRYELAGKKFNRLVVVSFERMDKNNGSIWKCLCDCGNETFVSVSRLTKGYTRP